MIKPDPARAAAALLATGLRQIADVLDPPPVRNITVVMGDSFAGDSPRYRRIRKEMAS